MATKYADILNSVVNAGGTTAHVLPDVARSGGRMRVVTDNFEVATGDLTAADIIVLARLPANAVIHRLFICNDDLDAGTALLSDVGIYETDGTAVDIDAFADGDDFLSDAAAPPGEDMRYLAASDPTDMGQRIWESGGESADPSAMRDIAITIDTAATTAQAGTIGYRIEYTID